MVDRGLMGTSKQTCACHTLLLFSKLFYRKANDDFPEPAYVQSNVNKAILSFGS